MSWKDDYKEAMLAFLEKNGKIVTNGSHTYSWTDWDHYDNNFNYKCGGLVFPAEPQIEEISWSEWGGTFASQDDVCHGVQIGGVSCKCGHFTNRTLRYDGTVGEVLMGLLNE